jgi:hypothetical protein
MQPVVEIQVVASLHRYRHTRQRGLFASPVGPALRLADLQHEGVGVLQDIAVALKAGLAPPVALVIPDRSRVSMVRVSSDLRQAYGSSGFMVRAPLHELGPAGVLRTQEPRLRW